MRNDYRKLTRNQIKTNKSISPSTVKVYAGSIKTFYSYFGYPLRRTASLPQQVKASQGKLENEKFPYRPESVKKLLSAIDNNRDKAIVLTMFQSGMDISTTLSLTYGHIKKGLESGEYPLMIRVIRPKVGTSYRTFIGRDAIEAIKVYLEERTTVRYKCSKCGFSWKVKRHKCPPPCNSTDIIPEREDLSVDSQLFVSKTGKVGRIAYDFQASLKRYVVLAGLITKDEMERSDINPARPHALRAAFNSILSLKGANQQLIDYMMGHADPYGGAYNRVSNEELLDLYSRYVEFLSISDLMELSNIVEAFEKKLEQRDFMITGMEERLRELEERDRKKAAIIAGDEGNDKLQLVFELMQIVESNPDTMKTMVKELKKVQGN